MNEKGEENGDLITLSTTTEKRTKNNSLSIFDDANTVTTTNNDDVETSVLVLAPPSISPATINLDHDDIIATGTADATTMTTSATDSSTTTTTTTTTATTRRLRLAEKRRTSTCAFANRVARLSIDHYKRHVDIAFQCTQKQTCLSCLVAHEAETNELYVVAMGVGTKFLTEQTLQLEEQQISSAGGHVVVANNNNNNDGSACHHQQQHVYGSRVRDGHAEVLCRRAFRRYLTESILSTKRRQRQQQHQWEDLTIADRAVTDTAKAGNKEEDPQPQLPIILQPVSETNSITPCHDADDVASSTTLRIGCCDDLRSYWQLRPGVTLHAYCSSAPCGNAVLKKFTSMKKEEFCHDLGDDKWPKPTHAPMLGHAIRMGQFALLLKMDRSGGIGDGGNSSTSSSSSAGNKGSAAIEQDQEQSGKLKSKVSTTTERSNPTTTTSASTTAPPLSSSSSASWPARQSTNWCPPGTTTVWAAADHHEESGSLHTCSDKLCRWNCLGWQGSLLSSWIPLPIHVETITVGRKLSSVCCRRAVCCRIEHQQQEQQPTNTNEHEMATTAGGGDVVVGTSTSSAGGKRKSKRKNVVYLTLPYKVNHPAILGTDVYMDETGMIEMSLSPGAEEGQDVRFHSSICWAWWPGLDKAEAINGTTGYAMSDNNNNNNHDSNGVMDKNSTSLSRVSTASLVKLFLQAQDCGDNAKLKKATPPPLTLSELREFKHRISPVYENAKELLLTKHPVLRQWKRRAASSANLC